MVAALRAAGCVFAEDEAALLFESFSGAGLDAAVARRVDGEPLEQILGWASFCGLRILVSPEVFVPRRRTELVARLAVSLAPRVAVDLCCGSGAIGAVLLTSVPGLVLHAAELLPASVACARRNLSPLDGNVHLGDLFSALPSSLRGTVDVLTCNAPYVPSDAIALMPPEAPDHEPRATLDGGTDGTAVLRRVLAGAPSWLAPGGSVIVECAPSQLVALSAAGSTAGLSMRAEQDDEIGATVLVGVAS